MKAIFMLLACGCGAYGLDPALDVSQYAHKSWTSRDGFFKGAVSVIAQTPDGYLWLSTVFGLLRFDGVGCVPWQPPAGQSLPDQYVSWLLTARDGRLWIGTRMGVVSWKDGKLTHYPELIGGFSGPLLEDREGTIWAGRYGGREGSCVRFTGVRRGATEKTAVSARALTSLYEDRAGNLWAGGLAYLWRWKPGTPKFYRLPDRSFRSTALTKATTVSC